MTIIHPSYPFTEGKRWFRLLSNDTPVTVVTEAQCTGNVSDPLTPSASVCFPVDLSNDEVVPPSSLSPTAKGLIAAATIITAAVGVAGLVLLMRARRTRLGASGDTVERSPLHLVN